MNEAASVRKTPLDISCLTSGNSLLIKIDNVNIIQNQFDKFLEKIVNKEKTIHDLKLPMFIIDSFSKLFQNWLMYPELKELINGDLFRDVFSQLSNTFVPEKPNHAVEEIQPPVLPEHSYFKIYCNECNEQLKIINDDVQLSYDLHFQDAHPRNSRMSRSSSVSDKISDVKPSLASISDASKDNCVPSVSKIPKLLDLNLDVSPCSWRLPEPVPELKLPSVSDPFCEPCCKKVTGSLGTIIDHKNTISHKKQEVMYRRCQILLKKHRGVIFLIDKSSFLFFCSVCEKKQTGTNCLIQHCETAAHKRNARKT